MNEYLDKRQRGECPDFRIKEALLHAVGYLNDRIEEYPDMQVNMEPMLLTHVLDELKSDQAFMRLRACWMYG